MIQVKELRVGNYVNHNNFKVPMMVSGLILEDSRCRVAVIGSNSTLMCGGSWSAIPLTEQWLIDFGFKKHITMDIYPTYSLNNVNVNDGVVYIVGFGFVNYIKHVHQLQNLYFALTGIELIKQ
jgi:hypothetical protein